MSTTTQQLENTEEYTQNYDQMTFTVLILVASSLPQCSTSNIEIGHMFHRESGS